MDLIYNIKRLAGKKGYSLPKLAEQVGLNSNSIYKWDSHPPSVKYLKRVADLLDVTVDELLK